MLSERWPGRLTPAPKNRAEEERDYPSDRGSCAEPKHVSRITFIGLHFQLAYRPFQYNSAKSFAFERAVCAGTGSGDSRFLKPQKTKFEFCGIRWSA